MDYREILFERKGKIAGQPGDRRLEGGDDIGEEPRRVIVGGIQREPGHRPRQAAQPLAHAARLAEAGRGRD